LLDVVNYFETVFKKPPPPKLTSYRRLPSVTDAYSEKDTASDSEVTGTNKRTTFVSSSCRSSPTAIHRLGNTYINTHFSFIEEYSSDSDEKMSQNKKSTKKATAASDDDDRKKGLRQSTIAKSKNNDVLSLVLSAVPDLTGVTGGKKAASVPITISTEGATGASMDPPPTAAANQHTPQDRTTTPTALTPKGLGLQDDSIDFANSPSQQKEHLLLQSQIIAHQGVGVSDPDLQATFKDPVHLTVVPSTYEELERLENERYLQEKYQKQMAASTGSTPGNENASTPKRKSNKKHKMPPKDGDLSSSSSSSSVEKMEEEQDPPTVRKPLHPASKRLGELEQRVSYLTEVVTNMTEKLGKYIETQQTMSNHVNTLSQITQDHSEKILTQGAGIRSLQNLTGSIQHRLTEVEEAVEANTRRLAVTVDTVTRLDNNYTNLENQFQDTQERLQHISNANPADGASSSGTAADSCETGIFLSGIQDFRQIFDMRSTADPVIVAARLMHEVGSYGAISRILVADKAVEKKEDRYKARAVIIYLNSLFHKRQTAIELKKFLQQNPGLRATVSDVFPAAETPRALALNRYAAEKRQDKSMTRTRVINKGGCAVLQHTEGSSREYKDANVTDAVLEPYFQARERGERGRQSNRRDGNSRNERELRDQERADQRHSNNSNQSSSNTNQRQHQQQLQLPQRAGHHRRNTPPLRISTPNSQPINNPRQQNVNMPMGNQQLQLASQQHPTYNQQQDPTSNFPPQQLQQHNMQPTFYDNNTVANNQWLQGANGPPVQQVNSMPQGGYIQVPQGLLPFIQQQIHGHQQIQQQQHQLQQYYTTENNNQQLMIRQDATNTNRNGL